MNKVGNPNTIRHKNKISAPVLLATVLLIAGTVACGLNTSVASQSAPINEIQNNSVTLTPFQPNPYTATPVPSYTPEPTATQEIPTQETLVEAIPQQNLCPMQSIDRVSLTACTQGINGPGHAGGGFAPAIDIPVGGEGHDALLVAPVDGFVFSGPEIVCENGEIPTVVFESVDGGLIMRVAHTRMTLTDGSFVFAGDVIGNVINRSGKDNPCAAGPHFHIETRYSTVGGFVPVTNILQSSEYLNPTEALAPYCGQISCSQ